jgi:hypothetical protein
MHRIVRHEEFNAVTALPAAKRYEYFVKRVVDAEEVWSLRSGDGWVMTADDAENEAFPVWSDAIYAKACAVAAWEGCEHAAISLDEFKDRWLPGLAQDHRKVAVFPVHDAKAGVVVAPDRLLQDLRREETKYE